MLTIAGNAYRAYESLIFDMTRSIELDRVEAKLKSDGSIGTVVFVHCETTTGVLNPLIGLTRLAKHYRKRVLVETYVQLWGLRNRRLLCWHCGRRWTSMKKKAVYRLRYIHEAWDSFFVQIVRYKFQ